MRKITIAAIATLAATLASAPAFATSHGHNSHGYSSHGHSHGHRHVQTYNHHRPAYHAPVYHAPRYVAPVYHAPVVYVAPKATTTYETRPAYVYQKVSGYCTEKVTSYGYGHNQRRTVECKAGEQPKVIEKAPEAPVEPPK
jgi:hypothetical protein